jgi:hypothetical protein
MPEGVAKLRNPPVAVIIDRGLTKAGADENLHRCVPEHRHGDRRTRR